MKELKKYIGGGEESYGFLPGEYVRDKDAVASCALAAEAAAWAKSRGKSLYETPARHLCGIWLFIRKNDKYREKRERGSS